MILTLMSMYRTEKMYGELHTQCVCTVKYEHILHKTWYNFYIIFHQGIKHQHFV